MDMYKKFFAIFFVCLSAHIVGAEQERRGTIKYTGETALSIPVGLELQQIGIDFSLMKAYLTGNFIIIEENGLSFSFHDKRIEGTMTVYASRIADKIKEINEAAANFNEIIDPGAKSIFQAIHVFNENKDLFSTKEDAVQLMQKLDNKNTKAFLEPVVQQYKNFITWMDDGTVAANAKSYKTVSEYLSLNNSSLILSRNVYKNAMEKGDMAWLKGNHPKALYQAQQIEYDKTCFIKVEQVK